LRDARDPDQLKRQARELLEAYRAQSADAVIEVGLASHGSAMVLFYLLASGFAATVSRSMMRRKLFSPTPRMFMISSIFLNGPFFFRILHDEIGCLRPDTWQRGDLCRGRQIEIDDLDWGLGGDRWLCGPLCGDGHHPSSFRGCDPRLFFCPWRALLLGTAM
jgi:hypothetical protein